MCRFVLYMGSPITMDTLITIPTHSIIHQSYKSKEREEPLNGDGFGVAWYAPNFCEEPAVFRHVSPAWSNRNLYDISRVTESHCILAHIRAASPGLPVMETNCHPFRSQQFSFMHNGLIPEFHRIKRKLIAGLSEPSYQKILGSTDSEHIFAVFLDKMAQQDTSDTKAAMVQAIRETLRSVVAFAKEAGIKEPTQLNLAVSDGEFVVASRFTSGEPKAANSLYLHEGKSYRCVDGVCSMEEPDKEKGAFLIASEPLSSDPGWASVPPNHMVVGDIHMNVTVVPC